MLAGDSDEDSSPPRSRHGSRDTLSDNERDSFGRPIGSHSAHTNGEPNETGDEEGRAREHTSRCLHVGNVPVQLTEQQLYQEFEKFGEVAGLKIVTHRSRRFAFVTFSTIEQAISAKQRLVKLTPWKSAISYAHKESITPPQLPKNCVTGGEIAASATRAMERLGGGRFTASKSRG